jgi:uncharacterized repeat protein (TIGR03803 family)
MMNRRQHRGLVPRICGRVLSGVLSLSVVLGPALITAQLAEAQTYRILHGFRGEEGGEFPRAGLIEDSAGNLYGTTEWGGFTGHGSVFELDANGTFTELYDFVGGQTDGEYPYGGVIRDAAGNLYGTTSGGGPGGAGTVFKIDASGAETILHFFTTADGWLPEAGLIHDGAGNLYGTTIEGGTYGEGTVFRLSGTGSMTSLYSFLVGTADGSLPSSTLVEDAEGNLYGTTQAGGTYSLGTVFKLRPDGIETVLHNFGAPNDGATPYAGLVLDGAGNLYGTTFGGGSYSCGAVCKMSTAGKEKVLYSFGGSVTDGQSPYAGLVRDASGNLYGTTYNGGTFGVGTVFKVSETGKETVLHSFAGGPHDGKNPYGGLLRDAAGNLYGTTWAGGPGQYGIVFELTP